MSNVLIYVIMYIYIYIYIYKDDVEILGLSTDYEVSICYKNQEN